MPATPPGADGDPRASVRDRNAGRHTVALAKKPPSPMTIVHIKTHLLRFMVLASSTFLPPEHHPVPPNSNLCDPRILRPVRSNRPSDSYPWDPYEVQSSATRGLYQI